MIQQKRRHSDEFKRLAVAKLLSRGSRPVNDIGEELGLHPGLIYEWVAKYKNEDPFMERKPGAPQDLPAQEKLRLVFEFEALPNVPRRSLERDLAAMVARGTLKPIGERKARVYKAASV